MRFLSCAAYSHLKNKLLGAQWGDTIERKDGALTCAFDPKMTKGGREGSTGCALFVRLCHFGVQPALSVKRKKTRGGRGRQEGKL